MVKKGEIKEEDEVSNAKEDVDSKVSSTYSSPKHHSNVEIPQPSSDVAHTDTSPISPKKESDLPERYLTPTEMSEADRKDEEAETKEIQKQTVSSSEEASKQENKKDTASDIVEANKINTDEKINEIVNKPEESRDEENISSDNVCSTNEENTSTNVTVAPKELVDINSSVKSENKEEAEIPKDVPIDISAVSAELEPSNDTSLDAVIVNIEVSDKSEEVKSDNIPTISQICDPSHFTAEKKETTTGAKSKEITSPSKKPEEIK